MTSDEKPRGPVSLDALRELPHEAQLALAKTSNSAVTSVLTEVIRRSFQLGLIAAQIYRDPSRSMELIGGLADNGTATMSSIAKEIEAIKASLDATIEKDLIEAKRALGRVPGLVQRGDQQRAERELLDARKAALAYADTNKERRHHHSAAVGYWIAAEAALYLNDVDEAEDHCATAVGEARSAYRRELRQARLSRDGVVTLDKEGATAIDTADLALAGVSNILNGLGRPLPERLEFGHDALPTPIPALHKRVLAKIPMDELAPIVKLGIEKMPRPRKK